MGTAGDKSSFCVGTIINKLPISDRVIIEAGTPFIKHYGGSGISQLYKWWSGRLGGRTYASNIDTKKGLLFQFIARMAESSLEREDEDDKEYETEDENLAEEEPVVAVNPRQSDIFPYIVADLKTMDRAETEVSLVADAGASAAIALGHAPIETLNSFIEECSKRGLDSMIDMMNVEYPLSILSLLKRPPTVVILHRGVDEEKFNKEKQIPLHEIRRIKGRFNIMISIAGGDTPKEIQRSIFNDADIVVVWKSVFKSENTTIELIENFLREIK